ncbi:MAG: Hpt domain-containing protein [Acetivibrio sp.]
MKEEFKKLEEWGCDIKNSLPRFVDDEEFYLEYIYKFKKEEGFLQLGNCLKEKKNQEAFEYAHMLKGVSGNLGLTPIYEIMCEMVEILRNKKDKEEIESVNTLYIKGMENFQEFCSLL